MSGGHFDYKDMELFNLLIENIEDGQLERLLKIMGDWVHAYDWCVSGDTTQKEYLKEREQALSRIRAELKEGVKK